MQLKFMQSYFRKWVDTIFTISSFSKKCETLAAISKNKVEC